MSADIDLARDLSLERVIRAPRSAIWSAWTDATSLAAWLLPAPTVCRVDRLEVTAGGALVTSMSDDGISFEPHLDACFLALEANERLAFTTAVDSQWRPASPEPIAMTAEIILSDHPDGTDYRVVVRHRDAASRSHHEELGFFDGWGSVTQQLADFVEAKVVEAEVVEAKVVENGAP